MNTFKVNEKEYIAKPFDFNLVCDLEDMGVSLEQASNKPMSMVRAYFALCANRNREYAGKEMETHILNGGVLDNIMNAMSDEMEKSDFFRNLNKKAEEKITENKDETSKKK